MREPLPEAPPRPRPSAVRELYDNFLRAALEHFFEHATLERRPSETFAPGPPRIEATSERHVVAIDWLGWRYLLRLTPGAAFSPAEVRLASSVLLVLDARYRAVLNPQVMAEKGDLFRGAIEDRIVSAFIDPRPYAPDGPPSLVDRITPALEVLRVAAVSSYENRPISTGLLLLRDDEQAPAARVRTSAPYWRLLTNAKSLFRLANGVRTLFLVGRDDDVEDVIDVRRWVDQTSREPLSVPCATAYVPHAQATLGAPNICVVLTPSREMKVFCEGAELFTFRNATWRLLDLAVRFEQWAASVGSRPLADRLFRTALDLADAREGALFVVLRDPAEAAPRLLAVSDRLDLDVPFEGSDSVMARRELLRLLAGRSVVDLDASVLCALAAVDGAIVTDSSGLILAGGAILRHPPEEGEHGGWIAEGARTTAALAASRFGPVLKVSEDGVITFFDRRRIWEI